MLTVAQLRALLDTYPDDAPVAVEISTAEPENTASEILRSGRWSEDADAVTDNLDTGGITITAHWS